MILYKSSFFNKIIINVYTFYLEYPIRLVRVIFIDGFKNREKSLRNTIKSTTNTLEMLPENSDMILKNDRSRFETNHSFS